MAINELVRWLRGDHDDLPEYADRLRERVAKSPPGDRRKWIRELSELFDDFAEHVRERMAREEEGGYLQPALEARPSLSEPLSLLKREHEELARIINRLQEAVHDLPPNAHFLLRDVCKRIEDLFTWIERHEEHENYVVLCAFADGDRADAQHGPPRRAALCGWEVIRWPAKT